MKIINPSIKHHTIIGALIGAWSFLFAILARPFEHGTMDLEKWLYVSIGFSLIAFFTYLIVTLVQRFVYLKLRKWNTYLEVGVYILFYTLYSVITFAYYSSSVIKGFYSFSDFFLNIILSVILILTPLLIFIRKYSIKLIPAKCDSITIRGENKLDILVIKQSELICISNAQNYVEIFFLENNKLKSKLIRTSLKQLQTEFEFLVQVHRSHLINLAHFKFWKDSSTIYLTEKEIPVTKSYKSQLPSI